MYDSSKPTAEVRASIIAKYVWDLSWGSENETGSPRQFFGFAFTTIIPTMYHVHIHSTTISAIQPRDMNLKHASPPITEISFPYTP
jgi:hypothetical protein